jgi:hypothetical protein
VHVRAETRDLNEGGDVERQQTPIKTNTSFARFPPLSSRCECYEWFEA